MNKRLTVLEFKEEAQVFADKCASNTIQHNPEQDKVIALSFQAQLVLTNRNIPFDNSLPYFDNKAHAEALVRSEEWLKLVEVEIDLEEPFITELSFCIRPFFSYLMWISEVINNAVEKWQPTILCSPAGQTPTADFHWKMSLQDRPLGFLMKQLAAQKGLTYEAFDVPGSEGGTESFAAPGSKEIEPISRERPRMLAKLLASMVARFCKNKQTLLISSEGYGLPRVIKEMFTELPAVFYFSMDITPAVSLARTLLRLARSFFKARFTSKGKKSIIRLPLYGFWPENKSLKQEQERVYQAIETAAKNIESQWRQEFIWRQLDYTSFIARKLRTGMQFYFSELVREQAWLPTLLKKVNPSLIITPYSAGIYACLGYLGKKMNIPTLMITHGSHIPPKNQMEEIEHWRLSQNLMLSEAYQYTVAQTPWAQKHAEYFNAADRIIKTPSLLFASVNTVKGEAMRKHLGIPSGTPVIVYAISQKKRSSLRFHVYETEDEYLSSMKDLVSAVNEVEGVHLVIKLHPSTEFTEAEMRQFLPGCTRMSILHREPFVDVLSLANVLVSYCSTAIEDALVNRIPTVLFDKWHRYSHFEAFDCDSQPPADWPLEALYYVSRADRLAAVLRHALGNAEEAAANDELYVQHIYKEEQASPLHTHVKHLLINRKAKQPS
jgi:hypothetical protein